MGKLLIVAILMLVASDNAIASSPEPSQPPSQPPAQVSMQADDWTFQPMAAYTIVGPPIALQMFPNLPYVTLHPDRHWDPSGKRAEGWSTRDLNQFLITTASPVLTQGWYVKMSSWSNSSPGYCQIYFQEVVQGGQYARWWSTQRGVDLIVGLEPEFWSNATSQRGDMSAAATVGFQHALANAQSIGVQCKVDFHDSFERLPPFSSPPTFTMDSFAVCDPFPPSAKQENAACALRTPDYSRRNSKYGP